MNNLRMVGLKYYLLTCTWMICSPHIHGEESFLTREQKFYSKLMKDYTKSVRPVDGEFNKLTVQVGIGKLSVFDLEEKSQILRSSALMRLSWKDVQLKWSSEAHGNISSIRIPVHDLWRPDITLYNSATGVSLEATEEFALVYADGTVFWTRKVELESTCSMDLSQFPFDTHKCVLIFGSWTYAEHLVDVRLFHNESATQIVTNKAWSHPVWEITLDSVTRHSVKYEQLEEYYADVTYTLTLRRRSGHITSIFVAPAVVLVLLIPFIFIVPPQSGRLFVGVGVLVTLLVFHNTLITELKMPHPTTTRIGHFYMASIILAAVALACASVVTWVHARASRKGGVPRPISWGCLGALGKLYCIRREDFMSVDEDDVSRRHMTDDTILDGDPANDRALIVRSYARMAKRAEWRQLAAVLDNLFCTLFLSSAIIISMVLLL